MTEVAVAPSSSSLPGAKLRALYIANADDNGIPNRLAARSSDFDLMEIRSFDRVPTTLASGGFDVVLASGEISAAQIVQVVDAQRGLLPAPVVVIADELNEEVARGWLDAGASDVVMADELWRLPYLLRRMGDYSKNRYSGWERLVSVVQQLSMARDLATIMSVVRRAARQLTGADGATFVLRDGDKCFYADEDAIAPLWKGQRFPMSICISGWVMLNRTPAIIPDIYADSRIPAAAYRSTFVKSLAMVPIRTAAPLGAIGNYWSTRRRVTQEELDLLAALADTTCVAMESVGVYEELEQRVKERTRELEAVNRELESFSYSVSHDLRAPVRAVNGFAELLAQECGGALTPRGSELLGRVSKAGLRMTELIDAMLMLSRLSRVSVSRRSVNISAMAQEIIDQLREHEPLRGVDVRVDPELLAEADPALVRIVLDNVLSNAWKYTSKRADASIHVTTAPDAGGATVFAVHDNGDGFDMAYASRLFSPFHRLHTAEEFPGTGIGLATVQRVVNRHGGRVWAESSVGKGTSLFFTLRPAAAE